jgi:phosphatidylserine synthase
MQQNCNPDWKERIKRCAIGVPVILGIYLILILFYIYPHWPNDLIGWIFLILAGIPTFIFLELFGETVFIEKTGMKISKKRFSVKRIVFSIFVVGVIIGTFVLIWVNFGSYIRHHFG